MSDDESEWSQTKEPDIPYLLIEDDLEERNYRRWFAVLHIICALPSGGVDKAVTMLSFASTTFIITSSLRGSSMKGGGAARVSAMRNTKFKRPLSPPAEADQFTVEICIYPGLALDLITLDPSSQ